MGHFSSLSLHSNENVISFSLKKQSLQFTDKESLFITDSVTQSDVRINNISFDLLTQFLII